MGLRGRLLGLRAFGIWRLRAFKFGVEALGFTVSGFRVEGLGLQGLGFSVEGVGLKGLGCRAEALGS